MSPGCNRSRDRCHAPPSDGSRCRRSSSWGRATRTCPPETDADRVTETVRRADARRVDIDAAGHQACSDVGLYLDLVAHVDGLPEIVTAFLGSMADQVTGRAGDPWRPTVALHLRILAAWLDEVLQTDMTGAADEFDAIAGLDGVVVRDAGVAERPSRA